MMECSPFRRAFFLFEILFEILHYDFYAIPSIEIAKITVEVNSKNYSGEKTSIRSMLADKANAPAKDAPQFKGINVIAVERLDDAIASAFEL